MEANTVDNRPAIDKMTAQEAMTLSESFSPYYYVTQILKEAKETEPKDEGPDAVKKDEGAEHEANETPAEEKAEHSDADKKDTKKSGKIPEVNIPQDESRIIEGYFKKDIKSFKWRGETYTFAQITPPEAEGAVDPEAALKEVVAGKGKQALAGVMEFKAENGNDVLRIKVYVGPTREWSTIEAKKE